MSDQGLKSCSEIATQSYTFRDLPKFGHKFELKKDFGDIRLYFTSPKLLLIAYKIQPSEIFA